MCAGGGASRRPHAQTEGQAGSQPCELCVCVCMYESVCKCVYVCLQESCCLVRCCCPCTHTISSTRIATFLSQEAQPHPRPHFQQHHDLLTQPLTPTPQHLSTLQTPTPSPQPAFLALYQRHVDPSKPPGPHRQAKLKSASQLQVRALCVRVFVCVCVCVPAHSLIPPSRVLSNTYHTSHPASQHTSTCHYNTHHTPHHTSHLTPDRSCWM